MLATYLLTHTFQHTLFDWLKFTWVPYQFGGIHVNFNQSEKVCWKVCVRRCVTSISHITNMHWNIRFYINTVDPNS